MYVEGPTMKANTLGDWVRRYWLWILVVGVLLLFGVVYMLPSLRRSERDSLLGKVRALRDETSEKLWDHKVAMADRQNELDEINAIPIERVRLKALADYANRHGRKP